MTNDDRDLDVQRLKAELADARLRRTQLLQELVDLAARLPEIRREFGNPFYYSRPEEPDEGIANYTGNNSSQIGFPTWSALRRVNRELERIKAELRRLGDDDTPH